MLNFALTLQTTIILWLLAVAGILYFLGVVSVLLFRNRLAKGSSNGQSRKQTLSLKKLSSIVLWLSVTAAFASAVAMTQVGSAMQLLTTSFNAGISVTQGPAMQAIHWIIVALSVFFVIGIGMISDRASPSNSNYMSSKTSGDGGFGGISV